MCCAPQGGGGERVRDGGEGIGERGLQSKGTSDIEGGGDRSTPKPISGLARNTALHILVIRSRGGRHPHPHHVGHQCPPPEERENMNVEKLVRRIVTTYTEQCEEVLGNRTIYLFNREHLLFPTSREDGGRGHLCRTAVCLFQPSHHLKVESPKVVFAELFKGSLVRADGIERGEGYQTQLLLITCLCQPPEDLQCKLTNSSTPICLCKQDRKHVGDVGLLNWRVEVLHCYVVTWTQLPQDAAGHQSDARWSLFRFQDNVLEERV